MSYTQNNWNKLPIKIKLLLFKYLDITAIVNMKTALQHCRHNLKQDLDKRMIAIENSITITSDSESDTDI